MNITKRLRKFWIARNSRRQLKAYYHQQCGGQGGAKYLIMAILLLAGSFSVLRQAATFVQAWPPIVLIIAALLAGLQLIKAWELAKYRRICQARIRINEFNRRLDGASRAEILHYLGDKAAGSYGMASLKIGRQALQGTYQGEKLAIYYFHLEQDEVLATQTMVGLLRDCRQKGVGQVRVFVNTDFTPKAKGLGERFEIKLRTYNGQQLVSFLADSPLCPSTYEVESIIKRESAKQQRRLAILRREAVRGQKGLTYLIYGGVLLNMAWFKIGYPIWDLGFGLLMLALAMLSLRQNRAQEEEIVF